MQSPTIYNEASEKKDSNRNVNIYDILVNNLLLKVQKPGQYLGIEWGHLVENEIGRWGDAKATLALIYPDLYELGMSNFGTKILYQIINGHPDFICDRAYAPTKDMEELLRKENVPLWGWESFKPLYDFDLLGFSLSYELSYTNVLNILELSHLEILSEERKKLFPIIFAGGPAAFNPEPMADFIDFFIVGDGEEAIIEVLQLIKEEKHKPPTRSKAHQRWQITKHDLLLKLAQIPGIYVPRFYSPDPNENYLPKSIQDFQIPTKVTKRVVSLTDLNQPTDGPIPYLTSIQDRQILEIRRGCDRGCRFCQAGYTYLPVRERAPDEVIKLSQEALKNTGYDECSLLSLSASDYTCLHEVTSKLNNTQIKNGISLSMPSQRVDKFDLTIANALNTVRKSGITLAPEAGTERLRKVINKGLKESDIKRAVESVYEGRFHHVKLYFMIGLPTETYDDLDGIINLLRWIHNLSKEKNIKPLDITCTISTFVPKAFTPFQWFSQNTIEELEAKIKYLKQKVREYKLRTVKLNCTEPKIALLEAVLSRGDRRISKLIYKAFKNGAKFDGWDECLNIDLWNNAANELNLSLNYEATKSRTVGSTNPWNVIETGILNKFLVTEYDKAMSAVETKPCIENTCHGCGVCFELNVVNEVAADKSNKNKFVRTINTGIPTSGIEAVCNLLPTKTIQKIEIIHTKTGNLKFISHLDLQRLFERALRRAEIPFAFTEGFNPRPKFQWLMPLPLYYESEYEMMHLELFSYVKETDLQIMLNKQLPLNCQVNRIKTINLTDKLPINSNNIKVLYRILTYHPKIWEKYICELRNEINLFLAQKLLVLKIKKNRSDRCERTEKEIDIRSSVNKIKILNDYPLEIELDLFGNTRAEIILDHLIPRELKVQKLQNGWQSSWKITKKTISV